MLIRILLCLFFFIMPFSIYAYELLSSKTTVSPGCEGGVLSHKTTSSFISNVNQLNPDESDSSDENLDVHDELESM